MSVVSFMSVTWCWVAASSDAVTLASYSPLTVTALKEECFVGGTLQVPDEDCGVMWCDVMCLNVHITGTCAVSDHRNMFRICIVAAAYHRKLYVVILTGICLVYVSFFKRTCGLYLVVTATVTYYLSQGSSTFQTVWATLTISMMPAGHKAILRHLEL
jgi:hypothetical protein